MRNWGRSSAFSADEHASEGRFLRCRLADVSPASNRESLCHRESLCQLIKRITPWGISLQITKSKHFKDFVPQNTFQQWIDFAQAFQQACVVGIGVDSETLGCSPPMIAAMTPFYGTKRGVFFYAPGVISAVTEAAMPLATVAQNPVNQPGSPPTRPNSPCRPGSNELRYRLAVSGSLRLCLSCRMRAR